MVKLRAVPATWLAVTFVNVGAQSLTPTVVATSGASFQAGGLQLDATVGEPLNALHEAGAVRLNEGFQQAEPIRLHLNMQVFLQGPFNSSSGTMSDALRSAGYLPLTEPYSALGFIQHGSGGERTSSPVLSVAGNDAVVDWVSLELRDAANNDSVVSTRNALLQRDGDVVETDGASAVAFRAPPASYFLCVKHRNHLAVLTNAAIPIGNTATTVDLTDGSTPTFGTEAQRVVGAVRMSWSGDVNGDATLKYTGSGNDRDPQLISVGGTTPNHVVNGYTRTDVNMDGATKYTGPSNDRDLILLNVGSTTPNTVRNAQLP